MKCIRQILVLVLCFPLLTVSGCKNSDSNFVGPWVGAALAPLLSPPILTIQSTFERSSQSRDILVEGDLYYVADGFLGLSVLQFTAYEKLIKIGRFLTQNGTGRGYSVAKSGDTVFLAVRDEGVYVLDVSDPENPVQLAGIATSSDASYVEVRNDLLYISTKTAFLIYDVSVPGSPVELGSLYTESTNQRFILDGNYAFIAGFSIGLVVIDISNPAFPHLVEEANTGTSARAIAKLGNYLFIGGDTSILTVYWVANPTEVQFVTDIVLPDFSPVGTTHAIFDLRIDGNILYVADGASGVHAVDITNPFDPVVVSHVAIRDQALGVFVQGRTLVVADENEGVHLVDIFATTDMDGDGTLDGADAFPLDPTESVDTDGDGVGDGADADDDGDGVADNVDVFPLDPTESVDSDFDTIGDNADAFPQDPLESEDRDHDGIGDNVDGEILPVLTPVSSFNTSGQLRGIAKDGQYVYAADGTAGVTIFEMTALGDFTEITNYRPMIDDKAWSEDPQASARSVQLVGDTLLVAARTVGLMVVDVSDPLNPALITKLDTPDKATFMTIDGDTLILSDRGAIRTYDISTIHSPVFLDEFEAPTEFERVLVEDGLAYIAAYYSGLFIMDVTDPSNLKKVSGVGANGFAMWAIAKKGDYIFTGGEGSGLRVYDVSDVLKPTLVAQLNLPDSALTPDATDQPPFKMEIVGNFLFVADGDANGTGEGIQVVDISDPENPILKVYNDPLVTNGLTWDFLIEGYTMLIGNYRGGIQHVNLGESLDHDCDLVQNHADNSPLDPDMCP